MVPTEQTTFTAILASRSLGLGFSR